MEEKYNPRDISPYMGKTFITENESVYKITADGRFSGRKSIEGAKIRAIAGVSNDIVTAMTIQDYLAEYNTDETKRTPAQMTENAEGLEQFLGEIGQQIVGEKDLAICVVLEEKDITEKGRIGFKSSSIISVV